MTDVTHGGHHRPGEGLRVGSALAVLLVALVKPRLCLGLMVEDFNNLLALNHLLNIAVDRAQVPLLGHKIAAAALSYGHDDNKHQPQREDRHQKQQRTQAEHHRHHAYKGQSARTQGYQTVLENFGESINVVGVAAHKLAVGVGVEIAQGQILHFGEQIPANGMGGLLGDMDHNAGIGVAQERGADVDAAHQEQHSGKLGVVAGDDAVVNQGPEQVGPADAASRVEHQAYYDHQQQPLGLSNISHKGTEGFTHIFRFLKAASGASRAVPGTMGRRTLFQISH